MPQLEIIVLAGLCLTQSPARAEIVGYTVTSSQYYGDIKTRTHLDPPFANGQRSPSTITTTCGRVTTWHLWAGMTGDLLLQVYRPVPGGYELIGQNKVSVTATGDNTIPIGAEDQISVQAGDFLGWTGRGIIAAQIVKGGHYGCWVVYGGPKYWPSYMSRFLTATEIETVIPANEWLLPVERMTANWEYIQYDWPYSLAAEITKASEDKK